eukprot:scaffold305685_cov39-Tisochrysis_lutea.AAC.1
MLDKHLFLILKVREQLLEGSRLGEVLNGCHKLRQATAMCHLPTCAAARACEAGGARAMVNMWCARRPEQRVPAGTARGWGRGGSGREDGAEARLAAPPPLASAPCDPPSHPSPNTQHTRARVLY